ncbi:TPA: hypothetical protein ACGYSL_002980, partial [Legionella pneumophila]
SFVFLISAPGFGEEPLFLRGLAKKLQLTDFKGELMVWTEGFEPSTTSTPLFLFSISNNIKKSQTL